MKSNNGSRCDNHSSPLFLILIIYFRVINILVGIILIGVIFFTIKFRHHLYGFIVPSLVLLIISLTYITNQLKNHKFKSCTQVPQAIHQCTSVYFQDGFLNRVGNGLSHSLPSINDLVKKDAASMLVSWCDHLTLSVTLDPGP